MSILNRQPTTDNRQPLVSVVIPVFNGAPYLVEAVKSVQKSTYKNIEIILIDDGSSDNSRDVCQLLVNTYPNIRFFRTKINLGLGRVLNLALRYAKGKYIARLNQDDLMRPYRIIKQVKFMETYPDVAACGGWINAFDARGHEETVRFLKSDKEIKAMWFYLSPFSDPTVIYRKSIARKVGGYDQYFWPGDDTQLWYRMGLAGKLANLQEILTDVRIHEGAASYKFFRKLAWKTYEIHRWANKHVGQAPIAAQIYWIISLSAGFTMSPAFNWRVYRLFKRMVTGNFISGSITRIKTKVKVIRLIPHPIRLTIPGVYNR